MKLKDAIRERAESKSLSESQLDALMALESVSPERGRHPWLIAGVAALFAVAAVLLVVFVVGGAALPQQIADEVAGNHQHLKPLEIQTNEVSELRPFFAKLNFRLVDSPRVNVDGWQLEGARHCSVKGQQAAQLRYRHSQHDDPRSLYMVPYSPEQFGPIPRPANGEAPLEIEARGSWVRIWVESGILLAMTHAP